MADATLPLVGRSPLRRSWLPAAGLVALCVAFLLWDLHAPHGFILQLRAEKLAALLVVGAATGIATTAFQTVAGNRIVTPSIMGLDALFVALQLALALLFGAAAWARAPAVLTFGVEAGLMMAAAALLFATLLGRGRGDVTRMLLTGVILATLLRSVAALVGRLIDPSEFAIVQGALFASFGAPDRATLAMTAALALPAAAALLALAPRLDVLALGRGAAIGLGVEVDRLTLAILTLVAALVAATTALVGPMAFLGLLTVALARALVPTERHTMLLPAAGATGAAVLVAGQLVFERGLGQQGTLAAVIELAGGALFLALVLSGRVR